MDERTYKPREMAEAILSLEVGAGATVKTVNNVAPDNDGNVSLSASDVGAVGTNDVGAANGVAGLDANSRIPAAQLPIVPLSNGGTDAETAAAALYNLINGTGTVTPVAADLMPFLDASGSIGGKATMQTLATLFASLGGGAKIQTGSYVGTGTYGSSNPCSLTFDFAPKLVVISNVPDVSYYAGFAVFVNAASYNGFAIGGYANVFYEYTTWLTRGIQWYCEVGTREQLNNNNWVYCWVAIG